MVNADYTVNNRLGSNLVVCVYYICTINFN